MLEFPWKKVIFGSIMFGAGLGMGFTSSLIIMLKDEPPVIYEDRWRTITTAPQEPIVLGHTSLNPDEIENILRIQAGLDATTTTTTSTVPKPVPVPPPTVVTTMPQPPSTLPSSSTTLPSVTTVITTTEPSTTTTQPPVTTTTVPETTSTS